MSAQSSNPDESPAGGVGGALGYRGSGQNVAVTWARRSVPLGDVMITLSQSFEMCCISEMGRKRLRGH